MAGEFHYGQLKLCAAAIFPVFSPDQARIKDKA